MITQAMIGLIDGSPSLNMRIRNGIVKSDADTATKESSGGQTDNAQPDPEDIGLATNRINQMLLLLNQHVQLTFSMDTDTHKQVVKVVDTNSGELIRQMPTDEMLTLARSIDQFQKNFFLDDQA